jgi:ribosomal protein L32
MRHTRAHTNNRRSHHALDAVKSVTDAQSGAKRLPHRVDETTGMYRGKKIFEPKVKKTRAVGAQGPDTTLSAAHDHAHDHDHAHADAKASKGLTEKVATGGRPKARSGMGGGA